MNKKIIIVFFIFVTLSLCHFVTYVFAGNELADYQYQAEKYGEAYKQFIVSRDKFLKYKVLSARDEAVSKTKELILQRNAVLRTYFLLLESSFRTTPGVITSETRDNLTSLLDKKISWFEEQSGEVNKIAVPSLDDLFIISDRIEDDEPELKNLAYQTLGEIVLGKIRSLQQESVTVTGMLKDEVALSATATQAAQLELWLREVEVKNYLAQKEIESGDVNLWNLKSANDEASLIKDFTNVKIDAEDARIYLNQANVYQKEIYTNLSHD